MTNTTFKTTTCLLFLLTFHIIVYLSSLHIILPLRHHGVLAQFGNRRLSSWSYLLTILIVESSLNTPKSVRTEDLLHLALQYLV
jgi:hypothetical protein